MMKQIQKLTFSALLMQWAHPTHTFTFSCQIFFVPRRSYSSSSSSPEDFVPAKYYLNADIFKEIIVFSPLFSHMMNDMGDRMFSPPPSLSEGLQGGD
jgi:hypothetical protein